MRDFNKLIVVLSSCMLCLLFILCSQTSASKLAYSDPLPFTQEDLLLNWNELPIKEDVSTDKIWSVTFTQPINKASLDNSSIFVMNENYKVINTSSLLSEDGKTVKISPTSKYSLGHPYYLYITSKVTSLSGHSLLKPTCMIFTIKADAIKVDEASNKQSIELKKGDILELTLPENYDGGYSWQFKPSLDSNILKVIDETYILPHASMNIVGGIGQKRWLIQAISTGSTSIDLGESRLFDTNSTISTFNLKITIK